MDQKKEQTTTPEKELNEVEISNISDAEFKTLVIRMLKELSEDQQHKKDPVRNEEYTIRNNLQGNNDRMYEAENQINDLEHKQKKSIRTARRKKNPQN